MYKEIYNIEFESLLRIWLIQLDLYIYFIFQNQLKFCVQLIYTL